MYVMIVGVFAFSVGERVASLWTSQQGRDITAVFFVPLRAAGHVCRSFFPSSLCRCMSSELFTAMRLILCLISKMEGEPLPRLHREKKPSTNQVAGRPYED